MGKVSKIKKLQTICEEMGKFDASDPEEAHFKADELLMATITVLARDTEYADVSGEIVNYAQIVS